MRVCVHVKGLFKEKHTQTPPLAIISSFSYNNNTYDRIRLASNSGVGTLIAHTRRVNIIRIKYTRCLYAEFTESRPGGGGECVGANGRWAHDVQSIGFAC